MYVGHRLLRTKFLPLFAQRRCPARSRKVWGRGTVSRSDGLFKIQGAVWRKPGAVRTLQPASFKHKNNTLKLCSQQLKTNFGRLNNYIRFYLWKRKIPPTQRSDDFVGWIGGKMNRVCCGAVNLSWTFSHWSGGSHGGVHRYAPPRVDRLKTKTLNTLGVFSCQERTITTHPN